MKKKDILFYVSEVGRTSEEIFAFIIGASFGPRPGMNQGLKTVAALRRSRLKNRGKEEAERAEMIRVRRIIQSLRVDGLLVSERKGHSVAYKITEHGQLWLNRKASVLPTGLSNKKYSSEPAATVTIITYDVPHSFRSKRDWLRARIVGMGFSFLQKSIFVGKRKIPQEFLDDLEIVGIAKFVEIFEITKQGTLKISKRIS